MLTLAVPVYNMEQFLPRCMETLLVQSCRDYEIVLIDDGSRDRSSVMCDEYAAKYPEFIRVVHKENGGLSSARNAGIEAAKGQFIVFPDPDDWTEPDYVETLVNYQAKHDADLVCMGYYIDSEDSCIPSGGDEEACRMTGEEAQRGLLLPPNLNGFAWNKLYRLDIIRENGLRFLDDVGITEDLDFAYRYLAYCKTVCYAPACRTYHYYQREGAATRSGFSQRKLDSLRTYEKIIADCEEKDPELAKAAKDEICTTAVNLIWMYENSGMKDKKAKKLLLSHIRKNLPGYLMTSRYGMGRKVQALLAGIFPKGYMCFKNMVRDRKKG